MRPHVLVALATCALCARARASDEREHFEPPVSTWPDMSYLVAEMRANSVLMRGMLDGHEHVRCTCVPKCECLEPTLPRAALGQARSRVLDAHAGRVPGLRAPSRAAHRRVVLTAGCRFTQGFPEPFEGLWVASAEPGVHDEFFCVGEHCDAHLSSIFCHAASTMPLARAPHSPPMVTFSALSAGKKHLRLVCRASGAYPPVDALTLVSQPQHPEDAPCETYAGTNADSTGHAGMACVRSDALAGAACAVKHRGVTTSARIVLVPANDGAKVGAYADVDADFYADVPPLPEPESDSLAVHALFVAGNTEVYVHGTAAGVPSASCRCDARRCTCVLAPATWTVGVVRELASAAARDLLLAVLDVHASGLVLNRSSVQVYAECGPAGRRVRVHNTGTRRQRVCARSACEPAYLAACELLRTDTPAPRRPRMSVQHRRDSSGHYYVCTAYGFYPKEIVLEMRANRSCDERARLSGFWCRHYPPAPNADGTFFARVFCKAPEDALLMTCVTRHASRPRALAVPCPRRVRAPRERWAALLTVLARVPWSAVLLALALGAAPLACARLVHARSTRTEHTARRARRARRA
ncbi:MC033 [Molluscum contagiosum virus subtype 2]|nr:MC033 [Molluscum contagiosum virus subtype 2]AYO87668.1 MC033 [Molluscum contagiosum virus subtype 2]AYO87838.1 MC033 [Molluscum contagiosum virus subtype 2]AYO88008.1 MC033 [Molluscum contagiosum virus subtype 2]AYO88178.1 MC033 [Molluscum contagiosum virus subtype 2]